MPVTKKRPLVVLTDYSYETIQPFIDVYKAADFEFRPCQCKSPEEIIEACKDADAVQVHFAEITRDILAALPKCRLLVHSGVGMDTIDVDAARDLGIPACNVPDYGIEDVATHTILLMLAVTKKLNKLMDTVKRGVWDFSVAKPVHRLAGRTFGTIGCGAIARSTIQKAQAFGMNVISYDPFLTQEQVASRVQKSRPAVTNALRLLSLGETLQKKVSSGKLSAGHARALLPLKTETLREKAAAEVESRGLSVRQTETLVASLLRQAEQPEKEEKKPPVVDYVREAEKALSDALGRGVKFQGGQKKGRIALEFYSADDREALMEALKHMDKPWKKK